MGEELLKFFYEMKKVYKAVLNVELKLFLTSYEEWECFKHTHTQSNLKITPFKKNGSIVGIRCQAIKTFWYEI